MRYICAYLHAGGCLGRLGIDQRRSYEAAIKGGELPEAYHAGDYAVYADLQLARDAAALSTMEDAFKVKAASASLAAVACASRASRRLVARFMVTVFLAGLIALPCLAGEQEMLTLMRRITGLAQEGRYGEATALARKLTSGENAHPSIWAPFVLVGNGSP
jgi:hypothetical protein